MKLGAHMSIAGGVDTAFDRGQQVGCDCMQIFTKSSNQWKARPLSAEEIALYHEKQARTGIEPVVSHSSYLLNLATPDDALWQKSLDSLLIEMERCELLRIPYLVIHPGAHMDSGEGAGLQRIAAALDRAYAERPDDQVKIGLEITAGQGTALCYRFEHIAWILGKVREPQRYVACFDTAHALAAGYEIRTAEGYAETFAEFDRIIGLGRLAVFHFNDTGKKLGSRVDRHEHIGKGVLGTESFRMIMNDPRFRDIPMILETPKGPDMKEDIENLAVLRSLVRPSPA
jgi:deoxyribonuclease-4